jgi:hypothetical protein
MRRPVLVGALVAAVIALVASLAVAIGAAAVSPPSGPMMRGYCQSGVLGRMGHHGQRSGAGMMGRSMMGSGQGMGAWNHTWHGTFIAMQDS